MSTTSGHKRIAVLCILRAENRVLLLRRDKEPNRGLLTPVGGKLEPHESPRNAVIREVFEETGIQLNDIDYCGVLVDNAPTDYNWICFVYAAQIPFSKPSPCDEGELTWVDTNDLATVDLPVTDLPIYQFSQQRRPFMINAQFDTNMNLVALTEEISGEDLLA